MKVLSYVTIAFLGILLLPILSNGKAHADEQKGEVKQPRVLQADKNLSMGGVRFHAPTFKIEGSKVTFSGGDYRNSILDFSKADIEALVFAEVLSELGSYGSGDKKNYSVGILLDKNDRTMFIDSNWVYYPGEKRQVDRGGPFAAIHMRCVEGDQGVKGIALEVNGVRVLTDNDGWAFMELKNLKAQVLSIKITDPRRPEPIERNIAVPVVCARPGLVHYKTITVDLSEIR